ARPDLSRRARWQKTRSEVLAPQPACCGGGRLNQGLRETNRRGPPSRELRQSTGCVAQARRRCCSPRHRNVPDLAALDQRKAPAGKLSPPPEPKVLRLLRVRRGGTAQRDGALLAQAKYRSPHRAAC